MHASRSQRGGFTLIEVLIALAIAVSLATLMLPIIRRPGADERLLQDAERIRLTVERAKERSLRDGQVRIVTPSRAEGGRWSAEVTIVGFDASEQTSSDRDEPQIGESAWALILPDGSAAELSPFAFTAPGRRELALRISPLTADTTWEWRAAPSEPAP